MDSPDSLQYLRFAAALVFVLCLMGGLAFIAKKLGLGGRIAAANNEPKRLKIVEILALDTRRRAVLLRRDDTEHLVIIGQDGETVVESGIKKPGAKTPPEQTEDE